MKSTVFAWLRFESHVAEKEPSCEHYRTAASQATKNKLRLVGAALVDFGVRAVRDENGRFILSHVVRVMCFQVAGWSTELALKQDSGTALDRK